MTSKALFINVAESQVILAPMSQFGCVVAFACNFSGSCSAMRCISARSTSLNAPPEAVKMILRNAPGGNPCMH